MTDATRIENEHFELEVRRIAQQLWTPADFSRAGFLDNHEVDGIYETEETYHILEATTSREKKKAETDIQKLQKLLKKLHSKRGHHKAVQGWFITKEPPKPHQEEVASQLNGKNPTARVKICSFAEFQQKLVKSREYLQVRENYRFGSVSDPRTHALTPEIDYIPLDLAQIGSDNEPEKTLSCTDVIDLISLNNHIVVLLGDYGAGKSMTLREIHHGLASRHQNGSEPRFPLYLNLRDHIGQSRPAEAFMRHAENIGFREHEHITRAWRAGYVHLILDGFDEISTINIQGPRKKLYENRHAAMTLLRNFIEQHPRDRAGLAVAGRIHFFDSPTERRNALGLDARKTYTEASLSEFTDDQISIYLDRAKAANLGLIPSWLPSRPLLVGYLASTGSLSCLAGETTSRAEGWNRLLDDIATREAQIESGIDGTTIRRILERLATRTRSVENGLGPIDGRALSSAFREICGFDPDERTQIVLERLPGLGVEGDGKRTFVDRDFADACRAGDFAVFVHDPYAFRPDSTQIFSNIVTLMGDLGIEVSSSAVDQRNLKRRLNNALDVAIQYEYMSIGADIVRVCIDLGVGITKSHELQNVVFSGDLEIDGKTDLSGLTFKKCYFSRLCIDTTADRDKLPVFSECYVDTLEGYISKNDLPAGKFGTDCVIEDYANEAVTTASAMATPLPLGTQVCITVLRKLYFRRGSQRKENALFRGLDHRAQRLVGEVLNILRSEGMALPFVRRGVNFWSPSRDMRRAGRIISAPSSDGDVILKKCRELRS